MQYDVDVYVVKGRVKVSVEAKSQEDAKLKAIKEVENAEAGFHGNYPPSDKKYLAVILEK